MMKNKFIKYQEDGMVSQIMPDELLVQQSQENMARKILEMMNESKNLEEAKKKVKDLLSK